jgi:hypothetical protein
MDQRFLFRAQTCETYHCQHGMDMFDKARFGYLSDQLARARAEKLTLDRAIQSPSRSPTSKQLAARRYSSLNAEIRNIVGELEDCLSVPRHLVGAKKSS